jgi:hypothetical protein
LSPEEKTKAERDRKRVWRAKKAFEAREMDADVREKEAVEKKKPAAIGLNRRRKRFWCGDRTLDFARDEIALEKKLGVGVNDPVTDDDGLPCDLILHLAVSGGHLNSVKALVEAGADVNLPGVVPWLSDHPNALFAIIDWEILACYEELTPPRVVKLLTGILDTVYYLRTQTDIDANQLDGQGDLVGEEINFFFGFCVPLEKALLQLILEPGMPTMDISVYRPHEYIEFACCKPVDVDIIKVYRELEEWVDVAGNVEKLNLQLEALRVAREARRNSRAGNDLVEEDVDRIEEDQSFIDTFSDLD